MNEHTPAPDPHGAAPAQDLHRRVWELVPWVVAGGGSDRERALVHAHAAACERCADELAFHRDLHAAMQLAPAGGAAAAPDVEAGLERLLARLAEPAPPAAARGPEGRPAGGAAAPAAAASSWTRWLVAAVLVQALGLAALASLLWAGGAEPAYRTWSEPAPASAATPTVRLVVDASLALGELQALLAQRGLQIVQVRAEAGVLGLARSDGALPAEADIEALRLHPRVRLVSRVDAPVGGR